MNICKCQNFEFHFLLFFFFLSQVVEVSDSCHYSQTLSFSKPDTWNLRLCAGNIFVNASCWHMLRASGSQIVVPHYSVDVGKWGLCCKTAYLPFNNAGHLSSFHIVIHCRGNTNTMGMASAKEAATVQTTCHGGRWRNSVSRIQHNMN